MCVLYIMNIYIYAYLQVLKNLYLEHDICAISARLYALPTGGMST